MQRLFILLALTTVIFLQSIPAYCATTTFHLSVTIPAHVILNGPNMAPSSKNAYQMVQTATVVRNNKNISLTSIVVP